MLHIILIILLSVTASAFFSGMEIAFFSANKLKLEIEKKQSRMFTYIADLFAKYPGQYITTILVGNNVALVIYSLNMSLLIQHLLGSNPESVLTSSSLLIETLISTLFIIFVAEFIPKAMVKLNPNFYYKTFALPVYFFYLLFYPVAKLTTLLSVGILRLTGLPLKEEHAIKQFNKIDLAHLLEDASSNAATGHSDDETVHENENELKLFQNAMDFSELTVRNCMVPRVDIVAVERSCLIAELTKRFIDTSFSRIFVYEESIDNIIGYVNTKSLFGHPSLIDDILKPVDYVTESMSAQRLMSHFTKKHRAVAIVIDEFGGTAGMVTLEDILEEIFGEIEDEHDSQDLVEKKMGDAEFLFSGRLQVDDLNEKYGLSIPESDEYDTLAGYVIYCYKGIPSVGEVITADNMEIKVVRMSASKLDLLRVLVV